MKNSRYFWFLILMFCALFSCQSSDADTSHAPKTTIYSDYFVRYLADEGSLKGVATFLEGDTVTNVKPLQFEGGVTFHGSGMQVKNIQDKIYRYVQSREADYSDSFKFKHTYKGKTYSYEIKMAPIEDFYLKGKVSRDEGMVVVVVGKALGEGESYVFLISDKNNKAISYTVRGPHSDLEFKIPSNELRKLEPGKGQLYIVKKQTRLKKEDGEDIRAEIEYYTKPIDIDIE